MLESPDQQNGFSKFYARVHRPWMKSDTGWIYTLLAAALILLAGLINYDARDSQWQEWQANPSIYFADGSPLVSSNDAGYFLSHAQDYQQGQHDFEQSRSWPDHAGEPPTVDSALDIPLLSVIISHLADMFHDGDVLMAGNAMIPFTALLTAMAIGLSFWAVGFPAEGAIAGLGAGLSFSFFARSSIGRIDTDQLVLFFISLILGVILVASRQNDWLRRFVLILLAAGLFHLFHWWYDKPLFVVLFPGIIFLAMLMAGLRIKIVFISTLVFVLLIGPVDFALSLSPVGLEALSRMSLINPDHAKLQTSLMFPDINTTIIELETFSLKESLQNIMGYAWLGIAGLIGASIWLILFPAQGIAFLPFVFMGLMSSVIGQRFEFYAAPMLWFGAGWLFLSFIRLLQYGLNSRQSDETIQTRLRFGQQMPVIAGGFFSIILISTLLTSFNTAKGIIPIRPAYSPDIVNGFSTLKQADQRRGGVIATWWDYGYLAHLKSGLPTLHDPGDKGGARTYLMGLGLIHPDQNTLINALRFISTEGDIGLTDNSHTATLLSKRMSEMSKYTLPSRPIYIVLTGQMSGNWMHSIASIGLHDIAEGVQPTKEQLDQFRYYRYECQQTDETSMRCGKDSFNLGKGTVNGQPVLSRLVQTQNGFIEHVKDFNQPNRYTLLIEKIDTMPDRVFILPHQIWSSSFNQLYSLGIYNEKRVKLIVDRFPHIRVYEILR